VAPLRRNRNGSILPKVHTDQAGEGFHARSSSVRRPRRGRPERAAGSARAAVAALVLYKVLKEVLEMSDIKKFIKINNLFCE
jgi:hypothetical protein